MDTVGAVIVLLVLFGVTVATMAVVGTVKAAKVVAAKVGRTEANARRAVENVALKAKSFSKPGAHGELATVRLSLRSSLGSTRQVLEGGVPQDGQLAESLQLLTRLDVHAAELDGELRLLQNEPDTVRLSAKLPELRERAARINHSADSLRWAAQDRMRRFADEELARLSEECTREAGALRHWDPAPAVPEAPRTDRPSPQTAPSSAQSAGPSGPSGSSGSPGASGFSGASGSSGPSGFSGPALSVGSSGPVGPSGFSGPSGLSGPSGPAGSSGSSGLSGPSAGQGGGPTAGQPRGIANGRRAAAEDVLGLAGPLAQPLARLAERLRRPDPGSQAPGR